MRIAWLREHPWHVDTLAAAHVEAFGALLPDWTLGQAAAELRSHTRACAIPSTLVALLRTVAYAWRQEALARNALTVHQLARELYARLSTMGEHFAKVGTSLGSAVTAYNRAVGSMEARVLVSARRLAELGVSADELAVPTQVEVAPRALQAPELVDSEYQALLGE